MPQIGTARIEDIEEPQTARFADIEQDDSAPNVASFSDIDEAPEVKAALASVPRPKFQPPAPDTAQRVVDVLAPRPVEHATPTGEMPGSFEGHPENVGAIAGKYLEEGPEKLVKGLVQAAKAAGPFLAPPAPGYEFRGITHGAGTSPAPATPEFYKGLSGAVSGGGISLLPLAPGAAVEAPLATGLDILAGYGTSKAAGAIAHKAGASPEAEDFWRTAGFWFPATRGVLAEALGLKGAKFGIASTPEGKGVGISGEGGTRAGVSVTPEEVRIGGQFRGGQPHELRIPRSGAQPTQPGIEAPTIEGQTVPPPPTDIPQPTEPHPGAPTDQMAEGASNATAMANEEAQAMRMVSGLPPTPPPAPAPPAPGPPIPPEIQQGHISQDTAAQIGTMIAKLPPDLRAQATQEAHQTLSQSILQMGKVVTPSGQLEIVTKPEQADKVAQRIINDEAARQEKILAESQKLPEVLPAPATAEPSKFERGLRSLRAEKVEASAEIQTSHVDQIEEEPRIARIEDIEPEQTDVTPSITNIPPRSNTSNPGKTGTAALSDLAPTSFVKGDQVVLPDGGKATVAWVSPRLGIVRVKTDRGRVVSIGAKQLKSAQQEPITPASWMVKRTPTETSPKQPARKNSSTQINLPETAAAKVKEAGQVIPDKDLAGNGRENEPHITVKYGVNDQAAEILREKLAAHPPFEATLGKIRVFPPTENSDGAAVVHAEVNSPELKTLHAEVDKHVGSKKDDFVYRPHVTLAYVRPEVAHKYEGRTDLEGMKIPVNAITVSQKDGKHIDVPLGGERAQAEQAKAPAAPNVQPTPDVGTLDKKGAPFTESGSKIRKVGRDEQPEPNRNTIPAEGKRPLRAPESHGGTELAGEPTETSVSAGEGGNAGQEPRQRSGTGDHHPPAVRTEGNEPRPGEGVSLREPAAAEPRERKPRAVTSKNTDWFQHPEDFSVDATPSTRLEWNTKALGIVKRVLEKHEKLTDEDRAALAHYVGWGALDKAFNPGWGSDADMWHRAARKLEELMTPEEIAAARRSTQNAHYTSPQIVRFVWSVLARMGFKGGVVLEPSMGTGNFFGMMPKGMRSASQAIGNELDPTTYNIAKLLYPSATSFNKDFVDLMLPNDSVDLAVSNVPFGVQVFDPVYRKLGKPAIHDYFFVKSLDKVRPGGVVAFITSTYTLDKQSSGIRDVLADKADLLFAVRMPQDTFDKSSGTAVSTDLIVLRKRAPGAKPEGESFVGLRDTQAKYEPYFYDKAGQTATKQINEYYAANPQNVLGELVIGRGRTSANPEMLVAKRTDDFEERLNEALERVPRNSFLSKTQAAPVLAADLDEQFAPDHLEEGNFALDDQGNVRQRQNGKLVPTTANKNKDGVINFTLNDRLKQLIGIRDATKALMLQMRMQPDEPAANKAIERTQAKLLKQIEAYRNRHGWFGERKTKEVFSEDPHYPLLLSLEEYDRDQKIGTPADILRKRTIYPEAKLTTLSSDPKDAFHAVFETIEASSSQFSIGLQRSYNLGFRGADMGQLAEGHHGDGHIARGTHYAGPRRCCAASLRRSSLQAERHRYNGVWQAPD